MSTTRSTTQPAQRGTLAQSLGQALRSLRSDERMFLQLCYGEGLTQAKIAAKTGVPIAVVSRTVANAMRRLGLALERGPHRSDREPEGACPARGADIDPNA